MKQKLTVILVLFLCGVVTCHAQKQGQQRIDSLLSELAKAKEVTMKVELYAAIMYLHIYYKTEDGLVYQKPALELAEKLNWKYGIAKIKDRAGRLNWRLGNFDEALKNHFEALKIYTPAGRKTDAAYVLVEIGQDYLDGNKYADAETWLLRAKQECEAIGDKRIIADVYDKLTYMYDMQGNKPGKAA
ncbi:hypothetical protein BH10BAC3_BH10BAC3_12300 [soil metagenome]